MYAVMLLALTAANEPAQCSARASCASSVQVQRVTVVRASCSTSANVAASCSGRMGLFANHHARKSERLQHRSDRHAARAGIVYVEVLPVMPTPAKTPEKKAK